MTTTPDTDFDDVLVPALDLDAADLLPLDDAPADDARPDDLPVDPAVVRLADTELVGPDDTHLGIVEVDLLPVGIHDDHGALDLDAHDHDLSDGFDGLDLDFGAG